MYWSLNETTMNMLIIVIYVSVLFYDLTECSIKTLRNATTHDLGDHTIVSSSNVFPYVAAILDKSNYLCAGALIDDSWVLTVADSVYLFRDSLRLIRVRLGSINNKKGGRLMPVKLIEFHPYFDDQRPEYDIALIKLADRVRFTPNLKPIRLQMKPKMVLATHFIVTAWPAHQQASSSEKETLAHVVSARRNRLLQVAHLHPTKTEVCGQVLGELEFSNTSLMCLDRGVGSDPCSRDVGAPVVLNGVLWGLVSSWVSDDCDLMPEPSFVVRVSAPNASSWIHSTVASTKWNQWNFDYDYEGYDDVD